MEGEIVLTSINLLAVMHYNVRSNILTIQVIS